MNANIPQEWAEANGWTYTLTKESKRPVGAPTSGPRLPSLSSLVRKGEVNGNLGFVTSAANDIIIIDVDGIADPNSLPSPLNSLVRETYTEYSLSGRGLHIVAKLGEDKAHKILKAAKDTGWEGQIAVSNNFMVVTGNKLNESPTTLATVTLDSFKHLVRIPGGVATTDNNTDDDHVTQRPTTLAQLAEPRAVTMEELKKALNKLPLDQNARIKKAWQRVTGEEYNHYSFWVAVGMAIHDESTRCQAVAEGLLIFTTWSRTDPTSYQSDDDVMQHWISFGQSQAPITSRTILALARSTEHVWPDVNSKGLPNASSWANFKYLLDYHELQLFYVKGIGSFVKCASERVLNDFFTFEGTKNILGFHGPLSQSQLQTAVLTFKQNEGLKSMAYANAFATAWRDQAKKINFVAEWLNTPAHELPEDWRNADNVDKPGIRETSTFDYLMSCIQVPTCTEEEMLLVREQIYRTFMQFLKMADPEHCTEDNGGFLAFIGPEACRKTSFFKWILPPQLNALNRLLLTPLTGEKSVRDFVRLLAGAAVVLIDECDAFLNTSSVGSMLKSVISGNDVSLTDIYGTEETKQERTAIVVGTSNEMQMKLSDNGNRRFWYVEVRYIEMEKICANISRYWLFQNLLKEYKAAVRQGKKPWLMDEQFHIKITNKNRYFSAESSAEIDLQELFSFEPRSTPVDLDELYELVGNPHTNNRVMQISKVKKLIQIKTGANYKSSELSRALSAIAVAYLGGLRGTHKWWGKNGGQITWTNGLVTYANGKHKRWLLPPLAEEYDEQGKYFQQ